MHSSCLPSLGRRLTQARPVSLCVVAILVVLCVVADGRAQLKLEHPPIDYLNTPTDDPIVRLQAGLDADQNELSFDPEFGYLPALLELLQIDASSQMLVFSKTSFQRRRISPRSPRAIYFGDSAYVGWVPGGKVIEISVVDPQQGAMFYTLEMSRQEQPRFLRQNHECLSCHAASHTRHVPGHFVRSVFTDRRGRPLLNAGTFRTDYTSPLKERWGGWYVTGTHGSQRHMGNVVASSEDQPIQLDVEAGANVIDLTRRLDTSDYLRPDSDIVALMVLEHQVAMHNGITAANYSARITQRDADYE